jgi:hypothetical protein
MVRTEDKPFWISVFALGFSVLSFYLTLTYYQVPNSANLVFLDPAFNGKEVLSLSAQEATILQYPAVDTYALPICFLNKGRLDSGPINVYFESETFEKSRAYIENIPTGKFSCLSPIRFISNTCSTNPVCNETTNKCWREFCDKSKVKLGFQPAELQIKCLACNPQSWNQTLRLCVWNSSASECEAR